MEENAIAIVRTEAYFNSSNGINKIRTLIWKDDTLTPRGVFQIAHGMAEHIGRYDEFAKYIASNGFIVCGNDHLGHGKSVNDVSDISAEAFAEISEALTLAADTISSEYLRASKNAAPS